MKDRPLVILGIDPGTTLGYAMLHLDGSISEVGSSKQMDLNKLIRYVTDMARVLVVSTDKRNPPEFVSKFAVSIGARVIVPKEDISVTDKKEVAGKTGNSHERDALASAFHAYKELRALIEKIDNFVRKQGKQGIAEDLRYLVIKYQMSIRYALDILEKEEETVTEQVVRNEHMDPFRKIGELHKLVYDLQKENQFLRSRMAKLEENLKMQQKINSILQKKQTKEELELKKDRQVRSRKRMITAKDKVIKDLEKQVSSLSGRVEDLIFMLTQEGLIAKKLKDLSTSEFEKKRKLLKIRKCDLVYVVRADIISPKVKELIEKLELRIIYVNKPKRKTRNTFISHEGLRIKKETDEMVLIDEESYQKKICGQNLIDDIITAHRKRLS